MEQHNLISDTRQVASTNSSLRTAIRSGTAYGCSFGNTQHMAYLSRVVGETPISMVFLLTLLVAWMSDADCVGNISEDERPSDVVVIEDVFFEIVHPPELEYTYRIRPAQDFGAPFNASFSERGIALVPVEPPTGCRRPDNADELEGRVALVWRGDCSFFRKTAIAEDAGAKAIIVADYHKKSIDEERESPLWMDHYYIDMASDNDLSKTRTLNIPAGFLVGKNGRMIKETLRRLDLRFALINIPVNFTFASLADFHQPPWVVL